MGFRRKGFDIGRANTGEIKTAITYAKAEKPWSVEVCMFDVPHPSGYWYRDVREEVD